MKQKIIFFGSGEYTIPVVKKLLNHGLDLVVTTEKTGELINFCKKNGIEFISVSSASDLTTHKSEIINHSLGVLASYGAIIPSEILNLFEHGIINIHPSLLPKHKGPSPIQYTLLNGEKTTGVTLIKLDSDVDHGPILSQKKYELKGTETTKDLLDTLFELGAEMVEELVIKLENSEKLSETPQDHSNESWSYKITKQNGFIDIKKLKANSYKLQAMIHAYYPWPGVWLKTRIKNQDKLIKLLPNNKIQVEGKNVMSYKDFENGYGKEGKEIVEKLTIA